MGRGKIERLLIVGSGIGVRKHLPIARELLPNAKIAMLFREKQRTPKGADHVFTSIAQALAFNPQAAVIANPAPLHVKIALPLAEQGTHLLMEKPIAEADSKGLRALIRTCKKRKRALLIGYDLRFLRSLQRFRTMIAKSSVGRILSVRAEVGQNLKDWRKTDYRKSVSARRSLGGGVLLELSHEIDYLRWLFGDITWVSATTHRHSDLAIDTEDTAHMILGFKPAGGKELVAALDLDFIRHDWTRSCEAIGTTGTIAWNARTATITLCRRKAKVAKTFVEKETSPHGPYLAEWKHFLDCVAGKKPLIDGQDGLATLKVVEAARKSSRGKKVIFL
jgi:predicted dehydrogenase